MPNEFTDEGGKIRAKHVTVVTDAEGVIIEEGAAGKVAGQKSERHAQVNTTQGFRKVDPDRWEFANEGFLKGQKHLLKIINRRKPAHGQSNQQRPQMQNTSVGACVEVGKFGLGEEVERLKRDKNVLMQELVRLIQQQQGTDLQLQTEGQRVQMMEQQQQQMMSKAVQSPGFLAQLVQHHNDGNRRIVGSTNKRRLSKEDEVNIRDEYASNVPNGQIVKYQPLMNEAAQSNDAAHLEDKCISAA